MTQKELAERTGIDQSDISKIETGNANPSLSTLKRLAEGMDMILKLEFIPKKVKQKSKGLTSYYFHSKLNTTIEGALVIELAEMECIHSEPENLIWIMPAQEEYIFRK